MIDEELFKQHPRCESSTAPGGVLIGTCSWTDPTLISSGRFYPRKTMSAEERLRYFSEQFPIVEVDSTYYALVSERNTRLWAERTPSDFVFDVKAFGMLTGHPTPPARLPATLRDLLSDEAAGKRSVYRKDLPSHVVDMIWETHRRALAPLHATGKLGAVLFQFPPWFVRSREHADYLHRVVSELPDFRIAVEFRGGGWMEQDVAAETLALLEREGIAYVSVDEPQLERGTTPPIVAVTSELAILRLHGRNMGTWQSRAGSASDRFNYLYDGSELEELAGRARQLRRTAAMTHVLFNNNFEDQGVVNARRLATLLEADGEP